MKGDLQTYSLYKIGNCRRTLEITFFLQLSFKKERCEALKISFKNHPTGD